MNINEILAGFEIYDGEYKREHIEAALSHKEEITPHLIAILEKSEKIHKNMQKMSIILLILMP